MNRVADDLMLQELERTEDYLHAAADAIDVKAGQILAAAAFLAIQPAVLLVLPNTSALLFAVQLFSFVVLLLAAIFAHIVLKIGEYPSPGFSEAWRDSVIEGRLENATEEDVARTILWAIVTQTRERVSAVRLINERKIDRIEWARRFATASFLINLFIVAAIMVTRFF